MGDYPPNVLAHFAPFHEWLDEVRKLSCRPFPEGGMNWKVDFSKRKSHLNKNIRSALKDKKQFSSVESINDINLMWSRFYWNAGGLGGALQMLTTPQEWSAEQTRLTLEHLKTVEFVTDLFASAQASGYWVSCEEEPDWMMINSIALFGNRALEHRVFWSID